MVAKILKELRACIYSKQFCAQYAINIFENPT